MCVEERGKRHASGACMPRSAESVALASLATFGDLLKHLRRRARRPQREVAIEVGYSEV
jgi:hypothetical protein